MIESAAQMDNPYSRHLLREDLNVGRCCFARLLLKERYVGYGIYHQLYDSHEWCYITRVSTGDGGKIEVRYLITKTTVNPTSTPECVKEKKEIRVTEHTVTFEKDDYVLVTSNVIRRPRSVRITTIVTTEFLDDGTSSSDADSEID